MTKKKAKRGAALAKPTKISTKLAGVIGKGPMPRTDVMKKIWAYIKKRKLQHPKYGRCVQLDAKLATVLKPTKGMMEVTVKGKKTKIKIPAGCVYMFDMAKQLNKHIESAKVKVNPSASSRGYDEDEDEDEDYEIHSNPDYDNEDEEEEEDEDEYDVRSNPEDEDEDEYEDEDEDEDY